MAKWGECDYSELEEFAKQLEKLADETEKFCEECAKELAARLLALVIPLTPVGNYPPSSGKTGGTLRRGWTADNKFTVTKKGDIYEIEVVNPVEYATYVEYGHRTSGENGWVTGRFFLTKSELKLDSLAPGILEKKLAQKLKEVFSDG